MRLRRDTRGEIGIFEDLQTLIVVVVGIGILLGSTMYNWSALSSVEQDQDLYDEAEHIVKQIEADELLRAHNSYGDPYVDFMIMQSELNRYLEDDDFNEVVRSDLKYNVDFDDLVIGPENKINETIGIEWYDRYTFGDAVPEGKESVVLTIKYTLVMDVKVDVLEYDVSIRHPCLLTVVVWR